MSARTRTAKFVDASIPVRGIVIVQLADVTGTGALAVTVRATVDVVEQITRAPLGQRYVSFDVDAAGNRYNARAATIDDFNAGERLTAPAPAPARGRVVGEMADVCGITHDGRWDHPCDLSPGHGGDHSCYWSRCGKRWAS